MERRAHKPDENPEEHRDHRERPEDHRDHRETHSSGDSADPLNSPEDRLAADPALEPELAAEEEAETPE